MAYNKAEKKQEKLTQSRRLINKPKLSKKRFEERMKDLESSVAARVKTELQTINKHDKKIAILVYKKERVLELWTNDKNKELIKSYPMTAYSGMLGPKNQEGDFQIPEGIYKATFLHPNSQYHLSIKVGYPNKNDKKRAKKNNIKDPGGEIFIHGSNVTIGCVPIGDHNIEELFYLVAKAGLSNTKILIAPQKRPFPKLESLLELSAGDTLLQEKYKKLEEALKDYQ